MIVCGNPCPVAVLPWASVRQKEPCNRPRGHAEPHWNEVWIWDTGKLGRDRSRVLPGIHLKPPGSIEIRELVRMRLAGLGERQKVRAARRAQNAANHRRRNATPRGERSNRMKCPVIFRAQFRQPKFTVFKVPGPIDIEIWQCKVGPPAE